jgi:hypothetical protein
MPKKRKRGPEKGGVTPPRQFRLGEGTLADLDLIAAFHTKERGKKQSRADAIRIAAAREADRIRRLEGKQ